MKSRYLVLLAFSAWLCGCALDATAGTPSAEPPPYDDEPAGELDVAIQAVRGGSEVPNGKRGVVKLTTSTGTCTGVLISRFFMLTAGHCVKDVLGNAFEGEFLGWVDYYKTSGTNTVLLHDTGAPMYAWVWPGYTSDTDAANDLAIVSSWRFGAGWPNVTNADFAPISLGTCTQIDRLQFFGQGYNAFAGTGNGILRTMPINLEDCLTNHFFDLRGGAAICHGDSGGPYYVALANGHEAIAGLFSDAQGLAEHACSSPGGARQRGVRFTTAKMQWIETLRGAACIARSSNGHSYKECF